MCYSVIHCQKSCEKSQNKHNCSKNPFTSILGMYDMSGRGIIYILFLVSLVWQTGMRIISQSLEHTGRQDSLCWKHWRKYQRKCQALSCIQFFATPWTVAHQAPPSRGFPRQGYWSRLPFPSPRSFPRPGIDTASLILASGFFATESAGKPQDLHQELLNQTALGLSS